jgi:hypothetical protein
MIIGESGSFSRKAYLRLVGKGLRSIGGLGESKNSSEGLGSEKSASSSIKN